MIIFFKFAFLLTVFKISPNFGILNSGSRVTIKFNQNRQINSFNSISKEIGLSWFFPDFIDTLKYDVSLRTTARWSSKKGFNAERDVRFYLHSKDFPEQDEIKAFDGNSLRSSHYNASHPTRIIIHGWLGSEYAGVFRSLTPAYLRKGYYNIILVDWGEGAIADYTTARHRVKSVGVLLARFIDFLHQETGTLFENIHLIGFSMGGHIAGIAGKYVQKGRIPVIIGLDPALPMFSFNNLEERLTPNDANYVEVIHSNAGGYGFDEPIGHVDFYVNYGNDQPGCVLAECSHFRAFKVFAESLGKRNLLWAKRCDRKEVFNLLTKKQCSQVSEERALLGGDVGERNLTGVFYLTTNFESPYARRFRS